MSTGTRSINIQYRPTLATEFLVNAEQGTGLQSFTSLSLQLSATGPLANLVSSLMLATGASIVRATEASLNAVVGLYPDGAVGMVILDPDPTRRGAYQKVAGAWVFTEALPSEAAKLAADVALMAQAGAEAACAIAAGYASDAVSQGNVPIYSTVAGLAAIVVPIGIVALRVNGYAAAGDGGEGLYKRVGLEPSHQGKFQSSGGVWWELVGDKITSANFGGNAQAAADFSRNRILFVGPGETVTVVAANWNDINAKLAEISRWLIAKGGLVKILLASGIHASAVGVKSDHPFGDRISIETVDADLSFTFSSLVNVVSIGAGNHGVKLTLASAAGITVGRFLRITGTTGTGDHPALRGYHEVTAVTGNDVTIKVADNRATLAAMTVTGATIVMHPAEVRFSGMVIPGGTDFYGLELVTNTALGGFGGIGLIGDISVAASNGIRIGDAAVFVGITNRVSVANWGRNGIWSFRNAMTYIDGGASSNCVTAAFNSIQSAQAELIRCVGGQSGMGFSAATGARNNISQGLAVGCTVNVSASDFAYNLISTGTVWGSSSIGVRATQHGYNVCSSTTFGECPTALRALSCGRNFAPSPTFINCPTTFNPPLNQLSLEGSINNDGTATGLMLQELRIGSGGAKQSKLLLATATFTIGALTANTDSTVQPVSVPGAAIGDEVSVETATGAKVANTRIEAKVSATDVVDVWANSSGTPTITARNYRVTVRRTDP